MTNTALHSKINDNKHNAFAVFPTMQTSGEKHVNISMFFCFKMYYSHFKTTFKNQRMF